MKLLSSLLDKRKSKLKISLTDKDIFYIFNRVIKEEFGNVGSSKLQPDFFKNKIIFVRTSSSNWSSELFMNRGEIIRKMNEELGKDAVREIKMK